MALDFPSQVGLYLEKSTAFEMLANTGLACICISLLGVIGITDTDGNG